MRRHCALTTTPKPTIAMPIAVEMPKMTDTMQDGVLVAWMVEEGEAIAAGDVIAQVETDKATMDVEAYDDGVLLKRVAEEGDSLPIGGLIAVLGEPGEDAAELLAQYAKSNGAEPKAVEEAPADAAAPDTRSVKASPLARRMATDHGLDLSALKGTGPEGRIIKRDIEAAVARPQPVETEPAAPSRREARLRTVGAVRTFETTRISSMRKTIARRLSESKFTSPHFYLVVDVAMERAVEARAHLSSLAPVKISYNDLVTKAAAASLASHPEVNSSYHADTGEIRRYDYIDIGIAVAVGEGLVTPVVRNADQKGLIDIARETRTLAERARERKLAPEDMEGSTFTTSNLGMFGMESFTAIINPPNAAILAIGAIRDVPVMKGGAVVAGKRMKLSLSCDHRVVDGVVGARFLGALQQNLEEPLTLLL